jgi:16S rRNA G527 N7-methylase RsmG
VNLTAAKTLDAALEILVLDALPVATAWTASRPPRRALDLGTGNGFPGAAVAARWPACRTTFVDRRAKKVHAVGRCLARAGLANVEIVASDGRELVPHQPSRARAFDLVTVRAVGDLAPTTKEAARARAGRAARPLEVRRRRRRRVAAGDATRARSASSGARTCVPVAPDRPPRVLVVYERPA